MYDACTVEYSWVWGERDAHTDTVRKKGREKNESVWGAYERTCKEKCNDHSRAPNGSIALVEISLSLSFSLPKGSKALPPDPSLKRIICTPFLSLSLSLSLSPKRIESTPSRSLSQKDHLHSISLSLSLSLSDQCTLEISASLSLKMINCTPDLSICGISLSPNLGSIALQNSL